MRGMDSEGFQRGSVSDGTIWPIRSTQARALLEVVLAWMMCSDTSLERA